MDSKHDYNLRTKPNLKKRFYAGLVDYPIIFLFMGILMYFYGEQSEDGSYSLTGIPAIPVIIFWTIMTVGMEQTTGVTIGNQLQNLRAAPISDPRSNLTIGQSLKRHLLDLFDLWPLGILGILFIKHTAHNQRLGDLWAKTIVLDLDDSEQGLKHQN